MLAGAGREGKERGHERETHAMKGRKRVVEKEKERKDKGNESKKRVKMTFAGTLEWT